MRETIHAEQRLSVQDRRSAKSGARCGSDVRARVPREVSPLARPNRHDPSLTEHADPCLAGIEIGAAYSELTDPDDQRQRFVAQQEARRRGDEEAMPLDEDFLEALEPGMPPAGGLGIGV